MRTPILSVGAAAAIGAMLLTAGCGSGSSGNSLSSGPSKSVASQAKSTTLHDMLPAAIKSSGVVKVASDASYPPVESLDNSNNIVGIDPDLGHAIGQVLGVKFQFTNTGFDGIIPALQAGRFDIAMSAMTDNPQREKQVDFVDYFSAGTGMMVRHGNPKNIKALSDLCGTTGAVEKGTIQVDQLNAQSHKCTSSGKKAINVTTFPDQNGANLALQTGRADAVLGDFPVITYAAEQSHGNFQALDLNYNTAPYGVAVPKKDTQLRDAIQKALQQLLKNGTYVQILGKWGVKSGALTKITVNAGGKG